MGTLTPFFRNAILSNSLSPFRKFYMELRGIGGAPTYRVPVTAKSPVSGRIAFEKIPTFVAPESFTVRTCHLMGECNGKIEELAEIELTMRNRTLAVGELLDICEINMQL